MPQTPIAGFRFKRSSRGAWLVQTAQQPTLGFGSGYDLRVVRSGCGRPELRTESARGSLSLCPSRPCSHVFSLTPSKIHKSLKSNQIKNKAAYESPQGKEPTHIHKLKRCSPRVTGRVSVKGNAPECHGRHHKGQSPGW